MGLGQDGNLGYGNVGGGDRRGAGIVLRSFPCWRRKKKHERVVVVRRR